MNTNEKLRQQLLPMVAAGALCMTGSALAAPTTTANFHEASTVQALASGNVRAATQQTIRLNGANSSSATGKALSYRWTLDAPAGSAAQLSNPNAVQPQFTVDLLGEYVARLVVSDGVHQSAPSTIRISTDNATPVANAGTSQRIAVGQVVSLDGSDSRDPDGDVLTARWHIVQAPIGSEARVDSQTMLSGFTPDVAGDYTVQLDVTDSYGASASTLLELSTVNARPKADAGPNRRAVPGQTLQFDAQGSSDPERSALSYRWSLLHAPGRSGASLSTADAQHMSFTPDQPGLYVVQLSVSDGANPDVIDIAEVMVDAAIGGSATDTDGDGIVDSLDNCVDDPNPSQLDTNGDGFGNRCDADIDNDGFVTNFGDLGLLRLAFFSSPGAANWNPDADFNGDNVVNFVDLGIMRSVFFQAPGPIAITFINPAGGSWHDPANWSPAVVPDVRYTVRIDLTGGAVVEYSTGTSEVRGVRTSSPLLISGGTLSVNGNAQFNDTLTLQGSGVLANANVLAPESPASPPITIPSFQTGIVENVSLGADVAVTNGGSLRVTDRLTLAGGSVALQSTANFTNIIMGTTGDDSVLDGTGEVLFDGTTGSNRIFAGGTTDRIIIGDGVTVRTGTGGGQISTNRETILNATVISDLAGTAVPLAGQPLTVTGTVSATNDGVIRFGGFNGAQTFLTDTANVSANGGEIELNSVVDNNSAIEVIDSVLGIGIGNGSDTWVNTGSVILTNSTLELDSSTTIDNIGTITGTGELVLLGNLDGLGQSVDVAGLFDEMVTPGAGGIISNATLVGEPLSISAFTTFNFDGVSLATDVTLLNGANLNVSNDLTLDEASIFLTSTNASRIFVQGAGGSTFTFGGTGEIVFNGTSPTSNVSIGTSSTNLVFEPDVTIRSGTSGGSIGNTSAGVTVRGQVISNVNGGAISFSGNPLLMEGAVEASNGAVMRMTFAGVLGQVATTAVLDADAAELELLGDFTINGDLNASNGATIDLGSNVNHDWINLGSINISDSTLEAGGTVATNDLGTITGNGLTVIDGFVDNAGAAFDAGALFPGDLRFGFSAAISGGAIVNTPLALNSSGERITLNDVTLATLIDLFAGGRLLVNSDLVLNNGTIGLNSNNIATQVSFGSNETINVTGQGEIIFGGTTTLDTGNQLTTGGNVNLVMGPDVVLRTETAGVRIIANSGTSSFTMQGTMTSSLPGRQIELLSDSTVIEGTLNIAAGAIANLDNYTISSGASVNLEIAGTQPTEIARLRGSIATLGGTLNVALGGGYVPTPGDVFEVATYNSVSGTFTTENLPASVSSNYSATALNLEAN